MNISDPQKTHAEVKPGDIIPFGRYSLDGWEYSPIEWIVLAKEEARILLPEWALHFGASVSEFNGNAHWWLRSPGHDTRHAALVTCDGLIAESGIYVSSDQIAVRPALWLLDL